MEKDRFLDARCERKKGRLLVVGKHACGMPHDWRKPNGLLTLHRGDTASDQNKNWSTNMFRILGCARGKQRCLTAVPNQKSISLDAGLRIKGIPALQLWDCVVEAFSYSDAEGNFARPSGKRHSQSQSTDHMSLDLFDHVPSNMPESSFYGRLYIFAGRHSYDHKRSWSSFETRVTNAPCNYS